MENPSAHILLVDDDTSLLRLLTIRLESAGFRVSTATSGAEALKQLQGETVHLLISDLRMDEMDGMALFREVQTRCPGLPVIIISAHGTIPEAVAATQQGIFGFLTKPVDKAQLLGAIDQALQQSHHHLADSWRKDIITNSKIMELLLERAKMAAQSDVNILVTGPSGTGKEVLARAIHRASPRRDKPFVAINCGALPEQLLESELFGHIKGAFTGAVKNHAGLFRSAEGGTLFLDEIGDMPLSLQVKLLRALQERKVRALGSLESEPIDVRIISATHRDLDEAMEAKDFREDLYYRLNVVNFALPALEDRREDIPPLVTHILASRQDQRQGFVKGIAPEAMALLSEASWPGNIRQLVNVVEQTMALTTTPIIGTALVRQALAERAPEFPSFNDARAQFEASYLQKVLAITQGSVSQAAKLAQRNRTDFYKLLAKYEIDPAVFKKR